MSEAEQKAVVTRMREAAKRTQKIQEEEDHRHQDAHVDSMMTTDAHVGKASGEPHKAQAQEDAKVNKASITGDPHVVTAPLKTDGKTTDEVTTSPEGARPGGGGSGPPKDMVQRATEAAGKSGTEGKGKRKRK